MASSIKIKWLIGLVLIILLGLVGLNFIIEKLVKDYIDAELTSLSQKGNYTLSIKDVDVEIFEGDVMVLGIVAQPTDSAIKQFGEGRYHKNILAALKVNRVELEGLDVFDILFKDELTINTIALDNIDLAVSRSNAQQGMDKNASKEMSHFSLDSIRLPGLKKINLNKLEIENYSLTNIAYRTKDTLASIRGKRFLFTGLHLQVLDAKDSYFKLDSKELKIRLEDQQFEMEDGLYAASFDQLTYSFDANKIQLTDFSYKPLLDNIEFSSRFDYSYLKNTLKVDTLNVYGLNLKSLLRSANLDIGLIDITSMEVALTRDKTKPYDKTLVNPMPLEIIQHIKQPVNIHKIQFKNTTFKYNEVLTDKEKNISVRVDKASGSIGDLTTIRDSLYSKKSLKVNLNAMLLNTLAVSTKIELPYNTPNNTFYISGNTKGTSDFEKLNPVFYPSTGIRFINGSLDGMSFEITCNEDKAKGELIMLYSDLEVEISKKDNSKQNTKTWLANTLAKKNNPNKSGKILASEINFKRVKYKDILNYGFKSVQSGILNIIMPAGKKYVKE